VAIAGATIYTMNKLSTSSGGGAAGATSINMPITVQGNVMTPDGLAESITPAIKRQLQLAGKRNFTNAIP
jgi:hypothetical protein